MDEERMTAEDQAAAKPIVATYSINVTIRGEGDLQRLTNRQIETAVESILEDQYEVDVTVNATVRQTDR